MTVDSEIHWHEGLFLRPHHLQHMQRQMMTKFARDRRLGWAYPYGLIETKVSDAELENLRVRFDRLHAIMPSGIEVSVPGNATLPSLDIKKAFTSTTSPLTVSLGVPLWSSAGGNTIEGETDGDWRSKRLYGLAEIKRPDENTGDNPQTLLVRRLNARLLLDGDDQADLEVLPLLRIMRSAGEEVGVPRRDAEYMPPCLVIGGSPVLMELLRDIANQVMASRSRLAEVSRTGFSVDTLRGVQFEQILRLRTLSRSGARLTALLQAPHGTTPFTVYLELMQLLAELMALRPDEGEFEVISYSHDEPAFAFRELCHRIVGQLKGVRTEHFLEAPFVMAPERSMMVATLTEDMVSRPNQYFLAIATNQDPSELVRLVLDRDQYKLMPRTLAKQRVFGIQLAQEFNPPGALPNRVGLHYFRLLPGESARLWE